MLAKLDQREKGRQRPTARDKVSENTYDISSTKRVTKKFVEVQL